MNKNKLNRQGAETPRRNNTLSVLGVLASWRFIIALVLLFTTEAALAHVFSDHAEPKVGAHIHGSPKQIKIWFTGEVEAAFSDIQVFGPDGAQVDNRDSHVDGWNKKLLIVSVPTLLPGEYKVVWHAVATDTHRTTGDFKFTIES
ncbi:MAG TPA: copper resistance protein CopC [Tepidisphaeraceae bacterium]